MDLTYAYAADITKSERDDAGNLMVFGSATNPALDFDGDRCDPNWLKRAMPEWFEWGNIREMHGPIAAGVGVEMTEAEGDDWQVKSKCVDPVAAKKIEEGVYKGYSIGIKNGVRKIIDGQPWIVDGIIAEISYVDRPCNPTAKLAFAKAVGMGDLDLLQPVESAPVTPPVAEFTPEDREKALKLIAAAFAAPGDAKPVDIAKGVLDQQKLDELSGDHDDVDGAMEAVATIGRLIISEANDLIDGQLHEIYDLDTLMSALHGLKYFIACEEGQMDGRNAMDFIGMSLDADILKRHFTAQQRRELAAQGKAMPGGRFPIENAEDVHNAAELLGTAKGSHSAIKQHIIKRARALGATDRLPEGWMKSGKGNKSTEADINKSADLDTDTIDKIVKAAVAEAMKDSEERTKALETELAQVKATPIPGGPVMMTDSGASTAHQAGQDEKRARIADIRKRLDDMSPALREDYEALAKKLESEL